MAVPLLTLSYLFYSECLVFLLLALFVVLTTPEIHLYRTEEFV